MTTREAERTVLLGCLTAVTVAIAGVIVARSWAPCAPPSVIVPLAVVFVAAAVVLRLRRDDLGREGRYVDLWSVPHFLGGALLALLGVDLPVVVALVVGWELVELLCRVFEFPANRIADVVLAVLGWIGVDLLFR